MNNKGIPVEDSNGIPMTESKKDNQEDFKHKSEINLDSVMDAVEDSRASQKLSHKVEPVSQPKDTQKHDLKSILKEDVQLDSMDVPEPESKGDSKKSSKTEARFESKNEPVSSPEGESLGGLTGSIADGASEQNVDRGKFSRSSLTPEAQMLLSKILLDTSLVSSSGEITRRDFGEKKPKKPVKRVAVRIKGTEKIISPKAGDILRRVALNDSAQHLVTEVVEESTETPQEIDVDSAVDSDASDESQKQEECVQNSTGGGENLVESMHEQVETVEIHEESEEIPVESAQVEPEQKQLKSDDFVGEVVDLADQLDNVNNKSNESNPALVGSIDGGFVKDAQETSFKEDKTAEQPGNSEQAGAVQEDKISETSSESGEKEAICPSGEVASEESKCECADNSREVAPNTSSQRDFTSLEIRDLEECEPEQDKFDTEEHAVDSLSKENPEVESTENSEDNLSSQQEIEVTSETKEQEVTVRGSVVYSSIGEDEIVESARRALEGKKTYEVTSVTSLSGGEVSADNSKQNDSVVPEYHPKLRFNSVDTVGSSDSLIDDTEGKLDDPTDIVEDTTKVLPRIKKKPMVVSNAESVEEMSLVPSASQTNIDNSDWMDNPKHVYLIFGSVLAVTAGLVAALVVKHYKPVPLENSQQSSDSQVSIAMLDTDSFKELATNQVMTNGIRDYNSALSINPDTVGWLTVIGTTIDTALLQNEDNEYYSRRNILGEDDWNGSCWVDSSCKLDKNVLPTVTVVYGHSMSEDPNGELFSQLKKFNSSSFCADHRYILTDFFGVDYTWEIFASGKVPVELDYTNSEPTEEEYEVLLADLKDMSAMDYQTSVSTTDKILILSTCTYDDQGIHGSTYKNYRYVVCAKLSH